MFKNSYKNVTCFLYSNGECDPKDGISDGFIDNGGRGYSLHNNWEAHAFKCLPQNSTESLDLSAIQNDDPIHYCGMRDGKQECHRFNYESVTAPIPLSSSHRNVAGRVRAEVVHSQYPACSSETKLTDRLPSFLSRHLSSTSLQIADFTLCCRQGKCLKFELPLSKGNIIQVGEIVCDPGPQDAILTSACRSTSGLSYALHMALKIAVVKVDPACRMRSF